MIYIKFGGWLFYIRLPIKGLISGRGYISPTQQSLIAVVFCLWVGPSTTDTSVAQFLHLWQGTFRRGDRKTVRTRGTGSHFQLKMIGKWYHFLNNMAAGICVHGNAETRAGYQVPFNKVFDTLLSWERLSYWIRSWPFGQPVTTENLHISASLLGLQAYVTVPSLLLGCWGFELRY